MLRHKIKIIIKKLVIAMKRILLWYNKKTIVCIIIHVTKTVRQYSL